MFVDQTVYRKAFQDYLRKGTPIEWSIKRAQSGTHYIWRTRNDRKVRSTHADREGQIFAWANPPQGGHPGEDYNCRCRAEPVTHPDQAKFEEVLQIIQAEIAVFARETNWNHHARQQYEADVRTMGKELQRAVLRGEITWGDAARKASQFRNETMEIMRRRSTDIGERLAQRKKPVGLSFDGAVARYTRRLFGDNVRFEDLPQSDQDQVVKKILERAGTPQGATTEILRRFSQAGRGLAGLSVAMSVYNIYNAEDPAAQALEEVTVSAAGVAGGYAGAKLGAAAGAAIGVWFGGVGAIPGAAAGAVIGALLGGAGAGYGAGQLFD